MVATLQGPFGLIVLNTPTLTIGYAPDNQLIINDTKVSPHHALICVEARHTSIMDLGSLNGTYVNEQQLEQNSPRFINTGDSIRIGNTTFRYEEPQSWSPSFPPTPNRESNPGLTPDAQGKPLAYTAYGQQQDNQPPPFSGYTPPPPPYNPNPSNPYDPTWVPAQMASGNTPTPASSLNREDIQRQFYPLPPEPKKTNNQLKIILIAVAALIVLGAATGGGIFVYVITRPQPFIAVNSQYEVNMTPTGSTSTAFRVSGHKFSGSSSITFLLDNKVVPGNPAAQSDNNGNVTTTLNVTSDWPLGDHTLTARDASGYTTKEGVVLKIVLQGQADTPGPNSAPPDDKTFSINATYLPSGQVSQQLKLDVTGKPDPSGGSVCRSGGGDGTQQTYNGTDNIGTYADTYTLTCSGTYKAGKLSFTETMSSDKYVYTNGVTCTEHTPYVFIHLEGTFSSATNIGGSYSSESDDYDCTQGATLKSIAQQGNWTGQVQ